MAAAADDLLRRCEQTREGERFFLSLSLSLSLSRQRDRPPDADETKKRKSSRKRERERERGGFLSLSKPNAHRTNNSMWSLSLSLSSFFFTTFFHPLLSLSLSVCVSKKSTNLSPRKRNLLFSRGRVNLSPRAFFLQNRKIQKTKRAFDRTHLFLKEHTRAHTETNKRRRSFSHAAVTTTTLSLSLSLSSRSYMYRSFCDHLSSLSSFRAYFCFLGF